MNPVMFLVGGIIFAAYMYFLIWNIFHNSKRNREENYPDYYARHGQPDNMDYDGMGNFSRTPSTEPKPRKRPKRNKTKTKNPV
jgi:hypothetical protein